jgi:hypothetical protein
MAPGRARDEEKERQWRRRIDQWCVSGLLMAALPTHQAVVTSPVPFSR